jgi:hypothetical protein
MGASRINQARNFLLAQASKALEARLGSQAFQIRLLGRPQDLHPFFGEITVEAGECETRAVDGRLADFPVKTNALSLPASIAASPHARDKNSPP